MQMDPLTRKMIRVNLGVALALLSECSYEFFEEARNEDVDVFWANTTLRRHCLNYAGSFPALSLSRGISSGTIEEMSIPQVFHHSVN